MILANARKKGPVATPPMPNSMERLAAPRSPSALHRRDALSPRVDGLGAPFGRSTAPTLWAVLLLALWLGGCGVNDHLRRANAALAAGRLDEAMTAYDAALRDASDPAEQDLARRGAGEARLRAALALVAEGEQAFSRNDLQRASEALSRARELAPAEERVLSGLSRLLALRTRIEQAQKRHAAALNALDQATGDAGPEALSSWRAICTDLADLRAFRRDYPEIELLWQRARKGFAVRLVQNARRAAAAGDRELAGALAGEALRYDPERSEAAEIREQLATVEGAGEHLEAGRRIEATGDLPAALDRYARAVQLDPQHQEARKAYDTARDSSALAHLAAARRAEKARKRRDALILLEQARDHGAADGTVAAGLESAYKRLRAQAATDFYKRGVALEKRKLDGAAMIAFRTAVALGGSQHDLGRRLQSTLERIEAQRRYPLVLEPIAAPEGLDPELFALLRTGVEQGLQAESLQAAGVVVVSWEQGRKSAPGRVKLTLARFSMDRTQRDDERTKQILDHIKHPPNPEWQVAQSAQAAALAVLNSAGDRLRPAEAEANALESKIAELDTKLAAIRRRVDDEDAAYYAGKRGPCPDGGTRCPESHGHKRWATQIAWHEDKIRSETAKLQAIADKLQRGREDVATAQRAFDAAERRARETPTHLREEVWRPHAYAVRVEELRVDVDGILAWHDQTAGREMTRSDARFDALLSDYSTPEIKVKDQLIEAERRGTIPDQASVRAEQVKKLLGLVLPKVVEALQRQGERLAVRAEGQGKPDELLHWRVLALGAGVGIDETRRSRLQQSVLDATGFDWRRVAVDLARIPW